jgi:hypothetical protein
MDSKKILMRWKKLIGVKPAGFPAAVGAGAIGLVICAVAVAMLIAARAPSSKASASNTQSRRTTAAQPASKARKNIALSTSPAVESAPTSAVEESTSVTLTGCLEQDAETFRLTDTIGTDAPKSRSWKSGFLKKGSATIEILDASNRLRLANYIGRRVSVTGTLVDRELQGHSLRRISDSCN